MGLTGIVGVFLVRTGKKRAGRFPLSDAWFCVFSWGSVAPPKTVEHTVVFGHLATGLSCVWDSRPSVTQVDDRRMTRERAVILPQGMWAVQAIREVDQEKLSREDGKGSHV